MAPLTRETRQARDEPPAGLGLRSDTQKLEVIDRHQFLTFLL